MSVGLRKWLDQDEEQASSLNSVRAWLDKPDPLALHRVKADNLVRPGPSPSAGYPPTIEADAQFNQAKQDSRSDLIHRMATDPSFAPPPGTPKFSRNERDIFAAEVREQTREWIEKGNQEAAQKAVDESIFPVTKGAAVPAIAANVLFLGPLLRATGSGAVADALNKHAARMSEAADKHDDETWLPNWIERMVRGVASQVPSQAAAGLTTGGWGMIANAAVSEADNAITDGKEAGLKGDALVEYVYKQGVIEAVPAAVMQFAGLGGIEKIFGGKGAVPKSVGQVLKQLGIVASQEIPEELVTELWHAKEEVDSGVNPHALDKDQLTKRLLDTVAQTIGTVGVMSGTQIAYSMAVEKVEKGGAPSRTEAKELGIPPEEAKSALSRRKWFIANQEAIKARMAPPVAQQEPSVAEVTSGSPVAEEATGAVQEEPSAADWQEVLSHEKVVAKLVRRYAPEGKRQSADIENFVQDAMIYLAKRVSGFDPARGNTFSAWATPRVRSAMKPEIRKMGANQSQLGEKKAEGFPQTREFQPDVGAIVNEELALRDKTVDSVDSTVLSESGQTMSEPDQMGFQPDQMGFQPESAAQQTQREAEEARPTVQARGFLSGGKMSTERVRDDQLGGMLKSPNEKHESAYQKAHGLKRPSFISKAKDVLQTVKNVTTRAQEHLPNNEQFAPANEFFRLLRNAPVMAKDEAIRTTAAIVDPLTKNQLELFERFTIQQNQLAALDLAQPLRTGLENREQVEAEHARLQELVDQTPAVREVLETRQKIVRETAEKLVKYDLLPESSLENTDTYYHQQVHFYMEAGRRMSGGGTRPGKTSRSFQRRRVQGEALDEEYDYNTSYLESEAAWLTDANMEIEKERLFRELVGKYDIKPALRDEAAQRASEGDESATWETLAKEKEGYDIFQPEPGNSFFRAFTVPERIVEALQKDVFANENLTKDDLRQVLAMSNPHRQFVVPSELVAELQKSKKAEQPHGLAALSDQAMKMWKLWTLLNPKRFFGYNFRNATGDLDPTIAANPGLLRFVPRAMDELRKYHGSRLALSADLRLARDLGAVGSGFAAEEVPNLKELVVFQRFFEQSGKPKALARPVSAYGEVVTKFTQFREDILRYAAFLSYLEQTRKGKIKHYGGARKQVVDQLRRDMGPGVAAAHLARNLLGDYGNITVAGNWIRRRLMPFWAFQEINLKRTPRLFANASEAGGRARMLGALSANAARTLLMSRIAGMYAGYWAFNNLIMPMLTGDDDEKDLPPYDRANPHILLGRNPDGSVRVFRNVGALGDFLEWFGLNELPALMRKYDDGQIDAKEIVQEMAKAPLEKAVGSLRPDLKGGIEVITGTSLFPEPLQPRSVRRDEAVVSAFGLVDEYKWMKGMVLEDGNRARPHYWQRWFVGVVDPRQTALSEMYDLRRRFLKQKGNLEGGTYPVSRYKEARDAAKNEDYDAFVEWKQKFTKEHGGEAKRKFKSFLGRMDPIAARLSNKDEREFEAKFLTSEQRGQLQVARQYAGELRDLLAVWWEASRRTGK